MTTRVDDRHKRRIAQIQNELTQLQASDRIVMNAEELMALADRGLVELAIQEYQLSDANLALKDLNSGKIKGRAVLIP